MYNNDILRRLRYTFNLTDRKMTDLFKEGDYPATRTQLGNWLKREDDPSCSKCSDRQLAAFLNGLIIDNRGRNEGALIQPEKQLNNNLIFRKLRIALDLKDDEILEILALVRFPMSRHELSAFFRRPEHKNYRRCKDQILRNFLQGLQEKYRPKPQPKTESCWK